jgi:hypothetical protein
MNVHCVWLDVETNDYNYESVETHHIVWKAIGYKRNNSVKKNPRI